MTDLDKLIRSELAFILDVAPEALKSDATLESYGVDSLHLVEMIMTLEEQLDILIDDEEAEAYFRPDVTVGEVSAYAKQLALKSEGPIGEDDGQ